MGIWLMPKPTDPQKAPFDPLHSWLAGDQRAIAQAIAVTAALLFLAAGVGLIAHAGWWQPLTLAAASVSLVLTASYFHPWLILGVGLNAGLIAAILWLDWPSQALVGA